MPVATYRQMSKRWMKKNRISRMDLIERRNRYREKMKEQGREDELPEMFSVQKFENMLKQNGDWPENPDWPEGANPITELEEASS